MGRRPPLIGTYTSPILRKSEVVTCLYRELECHVTSWSKARISWPRVQPVEHRGGSGLWVNGTLSRAIRTESAVALRYWFGVTAGVVWKWRREFGVGGLSTTPGSRIAIRGAALKGVAALKVKDWTVEERDLKSAIANRLGLRPGDRWTVWNGAWTARELRLLGIDDDEVIAKWIGRTALAVRCKRRQRGIPQYRDRRHGK